MTASRVLWRWLSSPPGLALLLSCAACGDADDPDPCELELAPAPEYLSRRLYSLGAGPGVRWSVEESDDWMPYTGPLRGRAPLERVITDQDDFRAFQREMGLTFGRVDFQAHDVLALMYTGGCGAGGVYDLRQLPGDGSAVLSADIFDASLGQPTSCAEVGEAKVVVEVPKTARPQVCVTMYAWPQHVEP